MRRKKTVAATPAGLTRKMNRLISQWVRFHHPEIYAKAKIDALELIKQDNDDPSSIVVQWGINSDHQSNGITEAVRAHQKKVRRQRVEDRIRESQNRKSGKA